MASVAAVVNLVKAEIRPSKLRPQLEETNTRREAAPTMQKTLARKRARKSEAAAKRSSEIDTRRRRGNVNEEGHKGVKIPIAERPYYSSTALFALLPLHAAVANDDRSANPMVGGG